MPTPAVGASTTSFSQLPLHPYAALRTPLEPFTTMLLAFARRGFAIVHAPRLAGALLAVTKARAPLSTLRPAALRFSSIAPEKMVEKFGLAGMSDEELWKVFDGLASPSLGGIPTDSLASTMARAYGFDSSRPTAASGGLGHGAEPVSKIFECMMLWTVQSIDTNKDSVVSWDEFRVAVRQAEAKLTESRFFSEDALKYLKIASFDDDALKSAFDQMDANSDGVLDSSEIEALFAMVHPEAAASPEFQAMVARVVTRLDSDGNKAISWGEFKSAFALEQTKQGWLGQLVGWQVF